MDIIDAQIHIWRRAVRTARHGDEPFTVAQALAGMDQAGVALAVLHPPDWDAGSTAYATAAIAAHPDRFRRYSSLDLTAPDGRNRLLRLHAAPDVLGLRFLCLAPDERSWPADGTMAWMFRLAEEAGMPVALGGPFLMPIVDRVATEHPALRLVVDHFGMTGYRPGGGFLKHPDVYAWARHPNVAVKLTGAPDYSTEPYPFADLRDDVRRLYDAYGPHRLFWGSDITRVTGRSGTRHQATWRECVSMFTEHLPWLPADDLDLIMGRAYARWHGLAGPGRQNHESSGGS
jgi:predicted TIM-barrel fold metal-dependent hydrolase